MPTTPAAPSPRRSRSLGLLLANVRLVRGGRRVLAGIDWRIRPGEHWVLEGGNGAGKTQLLKLLAGDVWPAPGARSARRYEWRGEWHEQPLEVREHIAYVGPERQDRYGHYEWNHRALSVVCTGFQRGDIPQGPFTDAQRRAALGLLARVGCAPLARRRFLTLSQGEQRLVLLARALAWRPALLLLDEPFNGLDEAHRRKLADVVARLGRRRLTWVLATHRRDEVPAGATHLARLQSGRLRVSAWRRAARERRPAASRSARPAARADARRPGQASGGPAPALLRARQLAVWQGGKRVLGPLDLEVRAGDCWVVQGPNGSGKSSLLGALYGEFPVALPGTLWRAGGHEVLADWQVRVGRVSPQLQAALPRAASALDCVVAGLRGAFLLDGASTPAERRVARAALRRCGAGAFAQRAFGTLSYGQARRVLFARALAPRPDILLLDEALTGLDRATRAFLSALLDSPALARTTLLMATHHRDEWPRRTSHELQLRRGAPAWIGAPRWR